MRPPIDTSATPPRSIRVDVAGEQVAHVGGMEGSADGRDRLDGRQLRGGAQYRRAAEAMTDEQRGSDICST